MDSIGHDQHPDAVAEVSQRLGQGLAVLATLGEAAARLAAEESRRKERLEEHAAELGSGSRRATPPGDTQAEQAEPAEQARQAERQRAAQRDRRLIGQTLDPDWLARADLLDLATVWRAARVREAEFPEARAAAGHVEERLREMYPRPMDLYDQMMVNGATRATAMQVAAYEMARTPVMRAHDGRRSPALPATGQLSGAGVDTAAERGRLVDGIPPATVQELERLGAGGNAAIHALREILASRATQRLQHADIDATSPERVHTAHVDEHPTVALPRGANDVGTGEARTAAQLAAEWYPTGTNQYGVLPAHVAHRRPANTPTRAVTVR